MAESMSREEAKKEFDRWFNPDDFQNRDLVVYEVYQLIDAIKLEHKKVVLPKAVGEQWDKLVASQTTDDQGVTTTDYGLTKLARYNLDGDRFHDLVEWWDHTSSSYETLLDAARYGWVPEPEKLYRVKVYGIDLPGLFYWKRDDGTLSFVQGGAGLPETEFTMDEIKLRQLENCEREEVKEDEKN
ncbi:hypothetical protein [Schleiferilactobacillus harbinensis]|uniref:DUF1642 domain-containing protein n=1 Tax=Schleiferilactobacillus harbinensis TaxID=304207 RepID=A0ABU7T0J3_9LACO